MYKELEIINPNRNGRTVEVVPMEDEEVFEEMLNYEQILEDDAEMAEWYRKTYHHPFLSVFCYTMMALVTAMEVWLLFFFH